MLEVNDDTFYTLSEINEGLGITIYTLRNWIKAGRLKAKKTGVRYFIQGKDLKNLLRIGTRETKKRKKINKELLKIIKKLNTELFDAVKSNDLTQIKKLIGQGADVNAKNEYGQTALIWAVYRCRTDIVRLLIRAGADVNVVDRRWLDNLDEDSS